MKRVRHDKVIGNLQGDQPQRITDTPITIHAACVANTNQIRHLAGTALKLGLPYALDARINTLQDANGIHVVLMDTMTPSVDDRIGVLCKCFVFLKLAGLSVDDPVPCWLSMRLRDYMRLQPYTRPGGAQLGPKFTSMKDRLNANARIIQSEVQIVSLLPDDMSPELADPNQGTDLPPADDYRALLDQYKRGER